MRKARFIGELIVRQVVRKGGIMWCLVAPLGFHSAKLGRTFIAPNGMVTDFASTPPGVREILPKAGPYARASVIHDAGYQQELVEAGKGIVAQLEKKDVDDLFLEGMEVIGIPKWKRYPMYWAVRAFGHGKFDEKRLAAKT